MERFFSLARGRSEAELIDLIAERYGWTIEQIMEIDARRFTEILVLAINERTKKRAYLEWLVITPLMCLKWLKFISFEDYLNRVTGQNIDLRPDAEILAEAEAIREEIRSNDGNEPRS